MLKCGLMKYYFSATALKIQDFMKKLIPIQSPSLPYNNSLAYGASFVYWDRRARIFLCYLATPWPTLARYRGDSLTHPILSTVFFSFVRPEGHREPRNEVGSLNPMEHLVGFEPGTFQFYHNALTHWATLPKS